MSTFAEDLKKASSTEPTHRQVEVLQHLQRLHVGNGHPPTLRELGVSLGVNLHATHCHLTALKRKGLVSWVPHKGRTMLVTAAGKRWLTAGPAVAA